MVLSTTLHSETPGETHWSTRGASTVYRTKLPSGRPLSNAKRRSHKHSTQDQQLHAPAPPCVCDASGRRSTPGRGPERIFLGPAWSSGSFFAIAVNNSFTFSEVFADVSKNSRPASLAYCDASSADIARLSGCSVTRSSLLPASAMMMFSFACR